MKAETEALLQECRTALLRQSDERIAALLAQWFENLIGEEYLDEERDDLCLLLAYHVQSWGSQISYATYTSWWEVEGYLEPAEGIFSCQNIAALRQRLLDLPLGQFEIIVEMAYQARVSLAELDSNSRPQTGQQGLSELAVWLAEADPTALTAELKASSLAYGRFESKEQRQRREEERAVLASQQGYLVLTPASSYVVTDAFRTWCKKQKQPYILVEPEGRQLALVRIQTKQADIRESGEVMARFQQQLPILAAPYIADAQAEGHVAAITWLSKRQVTLAWLLAEDAQTVAGEIVTLWSTLVAQAKEREIEREAERRAALIPPWKSELTRWRAEGTTPELPLLAETVVLPPAWGELFTREHLAAFLTYLALPTTTRESKANLVARAQERLSADPPLRALFFELFKRELAVPPWELETLLLCTFAERKRWTDEERLPILELRSFRRGGDNKSYPVFDRRMILTLLPTELAQWRAEHQVLLKERRSAAARAAAARRKDSSSV
ncbi:MAG TPA: hypothetical protein VGD98_06765 [Ktedonobacteraceae bacterium]